MIECTSFRGYSKSTLQGFADFFIHKWGIEIKGCTLHMKDGRYWIGFQSKEYTNKEGEKKFDPLIRFRERSHADAFAEQAKKAIDKFCESNSNGNQEKEEHDDGCPF